MTTPGAKWAAGGVRAKTGAGGCGRVRAQAERRAASIPDHRSRGIR